MKITAERLRQIITEEVIKEELAPEIAAPAIAAMLKGTDSTATSDIFGAVFDQMYGEGALEDEAERMASAQEEPEEEYPTDYQAGGAYGDRPRMGFEENLTKIIEEEMVAFLTEADIPDLNKAGPELEKLIQQVLPAIEQATEGNDDLKKLSLQRLFQLLQKESGVEALEEVALNESSAEEIGALRQQIGNMSYEIERMLVALLQSGYSMEDILEMARQLKKMEPHPADIQVAEGNLEELVAEVLKEVLDADADAGDYIEDFKDSDAPQFKGKSQEKRKEMAIAAHASAKEKRGNK
tara:strand:+ start:68 stop:955 length:888 start_codon:yes stop_codon:yes gene_type:complete